ILWVLLSRVVDLGLDHLGQMFRQRFVLAVPAPMMMQELLDMLQGEPGGVFASPVLQSGSDWAGGFESRDIVTAITAVERNGAPTDVLNFPVPPDVFTDLCRIVFSARQFN